MKSKKLGGPVLLAVLVILVVGSIVFYLQRRPPEPEPEVLQQPTPTPTVIVQEVETIVEVQSEITQEELRSVFFITGVLYYSGISTISSSSNFLPESVSTYFTKG